MTVLAAATLGLFGKVPAHGDFVRRGLPPGFVEPWDRWLQDGMATARDALGEAWEAAWDGAPAWRFALPPGACGPDAAAGVLLPSADAVGRRFPITVAALLPGGAAAEWPGPWFAALEGAVRAGRAGGMDADALAAALPRPETADAGSPAEAGWWTSGTPAEPGLVWPLPALPDAAEFVLLLGTEP